MNEYVSVNIENPPTPYQLNKLASIAMGTGSMLNKLRSSRLKNRLHYFVDELDYLNESEEELLAQRRRIAVKVGKKTQQIYTNENVHSHEIGLPDWRMDVFDTNWYEQNDRGWSGSRMLHRFSWDSHSVNSAEKRIKMVPSQSDEYGVIDDLATIKHYDILPEMIDVEDQHRVVTEGDLALYIDDLDEYFTTLKSTRPARSLLQ